MKGRHFLGNGVLMSGNRNNARRFKKSETVFFNLGKVRKHLAATISQIFLSSKWLQRNNRDFTPERLLCKISRTGCCACLWPSRWIQNQLMRSTHRRSKNGYLTINLDVWSVAKAFDNEHGGIFGINKKMSNETTAMSSACGKSSSRKTQLFPMGDEGTLLVHVHPRVLAKWTATCLTDATHQQISNLIWLNLKSRLTSTLPRDRNPIKKHDQIQNFNILWIECIRSKRTAQGVLIKSNNSIRSLHFRC